MVFLRQHTSMRLHVIVQNITRQVSRSFLSDIASGILATPKYQLLFSQSLSVIIMRVFNGHFSHRRIMPASLSRARGLSHQPRFLFNGCHASRHTKPYQSQPSLPMIYRIFSSHGISQIAFSSEIFQRPIAWL